MTTSNSDEAASEKGVLKAPSQIIEAIKNDDTLPFWSKVSWGCGGFVHRLGNQGLKELALPFFNILLGLNPVMIGLILGSMRIWDAITDPVMGLISDNTRSRFGRRRPYVMLGGVLSGVMFPIIWLAPTGWSENAILIYFFVTSLVFYTTFTIFVVPYLALGAEMTPNYHERARLSAYRAFAYNSAGLLTLWAFRVSQSDVFGNPITGTRLISVFIGLLIILFSIFPACFCKDRYYKAAKKQRIVKLVESFKGTMRNRPFVVLLAMIFSTEIGLGSTSVLLVYINSYYIFSGDIKMGATFAGIYGTVGIITVFTALPLVVKLASRYGKIKVMVVGLCLQI